MKNNNIRIIYIYYLSIIITVILFSFLSSIYAALTPLKICLLIVYLITLIRSILNNDLLSLYSIYLYTSGVFIYSRVFLDVIGNKPFLNVTFPINFVFSNLTGLIFLYISILHIVLTDIGFNLHKYHITNKYSKIIKIIKTKYNIQNISFILMIINFPSILYKMYIQFIYIRNNGYLSIFLGELINIDYPFWTKGSGTLFLLAFLLLLISHPEKHIFKYSSILFGCYLFLSALKGQRGILLVGIISLLYLYNRLYNIKIKYFEIFIIGMLFIIYSQFMSSYRTKEAFYKPRYTEILSDFIYSQGTSIVVPLSIIENKNKYVYRKYPYLFSPIFSYFEKYTHPTSGQTTIRLINYNNISDATQFLFSSSNYYAGNGTGASGLAEFYDFYGFSGIFILSFLLGYILSNTEYLILSNSLAIPFHWFFINSLIYLPRNRFFSFFDNLIFVVFSVFLYFLLKFIFKYCFFINKKYPET